MNKTPFSVILLTLISSLGVCQFVQAALTENRFDLQHGMLEQEMTATGVSVFETIYWMDYGKKVLTIREQEQNFLGMGNSSETLNLELDGKIYVWERDAETGTVQDIEKIQKQVLQGNDMKSFGEEMMVQFGAKEDGFLTKLGRKCKKIILTKMMNQLVCLWKKIPLYMEANFGGMVSKTEVLKIDESAPDPKLFVVPAHITFSPAPDLQDIRNAMKGNRNAFPPDQEDRDRPGNTGVPPMEGLQDLLQGFQGTQNQSDGPGDTNQQFTGSSKKVGNLCKKVDGEIVCQGESEADHGARPTDSTNPDEDPAEAINKVKGILGNIFGNQ